VPRGCLALPAGTGIPPVLTFDRRAQYCGRCGVFQQIQKACKTTVVWHPDAPLRDCESLT
jgi:hypothetical protein